MRLTRWDPDADEWVDPGTPRPQSETERVEEHREHEKREEREAAATGKYDWELRVDLESLSETRELADRLDDKGIKHHRRWKHVLIPAGARVLGETKPVRNVGEARLAVSFHRVLFPDGSTVSLDQFKGLNQVGDNGLHDRVNNHYLSTFGAAAAVGLVTGLGQYVGHVGVSGGDGDRTVVVTGNVGSYDAGHRASDESVPQPASTITIREGYRIKVYLTNDLELPAYPSPSLAQKGRP
jgi:hypothetical protein